MVIVAMKDSRVLGSDLSVYCTGSEVQPAALRCRSLAAANKRGGRSSGGHRHRLQGAGVHLSVWRQRPRQYGRALRLSHLLVRQRGRAMLVKRHLTPPR